MYLPSGRYIGVCGNAKYANIYKYKIENSSIDNLLTNDTNIRYYDIIYNHIKK